ncbi:MAG TPA: lamin tail domain-containing protein [Polyangia bacterium]|jgi:hypothetical protein
MQSRIADWRLVALIPLALLAGCAKAQFAVDAGTGGSVGTGGDGMGSDGSGTGGSVATDGGTGGEEIDAPINDDGLGDTGPDEASDGVNDVAMDGDASDGADSNGAGGEAGTDGPTGTMPTQAGEVLISEILYDSAGISDALAEWFEVYNPSTTVTYDLLNCMIQDSKNAAPITAPVVLLPGSYHTFARSSMEFTPDFIYPVVRFDNDLPDRVAISCNTVMIDAFNYAPATGVSGHAFSVDPLHLKPGESNVVGNYCSSNIAYGPGGNYGTPGTANPPCPAGHF